MKIEGLAVLVALVATTAHADIEVTFRDGAPKDRFTITNAAACASGPFELTIDLTPAPAGLIFDVTADGAGVEVFQPFEVATGGETIGTARDVADGDQQLQLSLTGLVPQGQVAFTIDLDDTSGGREITVSGSEIAGAVVMVTTGTAMTQGVFDDSGTARVVLADCLS